jgi:hypothetical protein
LVDNVLGFGGHRRRRDHRAAAMSFSSVSVITNALRLRKAAI